MAYEIKKIVEHSDEAEFTDYALEIEEGVILFNYERFNGTTYRSIVLVQDEEPIEMIENATNEQAREIIAFMRVCCLIDDNSGKAWEGSWCSFMLVTMINRLDARRLRMKNAIKIAEFILSWAKSEGDKVCEASCRKFLDSNQINSRNF